MCKTSLGLVSRIRCCGW